MIAANGGVPSSLCSRGNWGTTLRTNWKSWPAHVRRYYNPVVRESRAPSRRVRRENRSYSRFLPRNQFSSDFNTGFSILLLGPSKRLLGFFGEVVRAVGSPSTDSSRSTPRCTPVTLDVDHCVGFDERLKCWNGRWLRRGARRISRLAHATALHQNVILTGQGHRPKRDHQKQIRHVRLRALAVDHVALFRSTTMQRSRFFMLSDEERREEGRKKLISISCLCRQGVSIFLSRFSTRI